MSVLSRGDASELQQYGQELYRKGDFQAAVEAFTEASIKAKADILGILDNRAASYAKLQQFKLALRDAKQMIKEDKFDERGYLRCAQILVLDSNQEKALEVYAYALKTLKQDNTHRQLLQQLHDRLKDRFVKCRDPFTVLPREIVAMILSLFSFKQVVGIVRVSNGWRRFLVAMSNLWMRIDFAGARVKVKWRAVRSYIAQSKAMVTHAVITNIAMPSRNKVLEMFSRCPNLEYLLVREPLNHEDLFRLFKESKRLKTLITSHDISIPNSYISKFIKALPSLEWIQFANTKASEDDSWPTTLPNLRTIMLGTRQKDYSNQVNSPLYIPALHGRAREFDSYFIPNLENLCLMFDLAPREGAHHMSLDLRHFPKLRHLDLTGIFLSRVAFPPSLEYVRFSRIVGRDWKFDESHRVKLENLRTLIFHEWNDITNESINAFIDFYEPSLRVLHVENCRRCHITTALAQLTGAPNRLAEITELNISRTHDVNDSIADLIMTNMANLEVLDVSHTHITGCFIKAFADSRTVNDPTKSKVERLKVNSCENLSSDAVDYGRARGMQIITK